MSKVTSISTIKHNDGHDMVSTQWVADVTGKRKDNVIRDVRNMLNELYGGSSDLSHIENQGVTAEKDARGYIANYWLDDDHLNTLITGYSAKLRFAVNKELREYRESRGTLPDFSDPAAAARAFADQYEKTKAAQLAYAGEQAAHAITETRRHANAGGKGGMTANRNYWRTEAQRLAERQEQMSMKPTHLAELLMAEHGFKASARGINQVLARIGFQEKLADKRWHVLEAGKEYGKTVPVDPEHCNGKQGVTETLWTRDTVDVIAENM